MAIPSRLVYRVRTRVEPDQGLASVVQKAVPSRDGEYVVEVHARDPDSGRLDRISSARPEAGIHQGVFELRERGSNVTLREAVLEPPDRQQTLLWCVLMDTA